jgi:tripartite-type tricarboxylate transporter receptor subunit TctC
MTMKVQGRSILAVAALGLAFAEMAGVSGAMAQAWPTRPVKFIVSLGPGSGVDIAARLIGERLAKRWGQPVIVENRPSGDAVIAINALIGAHDDHTLLYTPTSSFTAHPYQHDKLPYDPSQLAPVARVSNTVLGFVVSPGLDVGTVADFIARIRAEPGKLNYATATGLTDLTYDGYFKRDHLDIARIAYHDVVSPMTDLAEGRIQAYVAGLAIMLPHIQAGRAKLIAVTNSRRSTVEANVPTVGEAGFPGLTFDGLVGVFAQRDMSSPVRERIAADVRAVLAEPDIAERLNRIGAMVNPGDGAEFAAAMESQRETLAEVAKVLNITPAK